MKKNLQLILLLGAVLLAIWPFTLFQFIPKWDNLDCYLPYKYFVSDNLWNGHGAWWNPYMKLGYPAYSDMQNGMWNPIVWFLMLFGKYTTASLVAEMIIYFVICAIGIYKFSGLFVKSRQVKYIISVSYALSGFMVDNSQIMIFLMGYAWLPWILYYIIEFNKYQNYKYALLAALFVALNTTSASPAYTVVLVYVLVFMVLYNLFTRIKLKKLNKKFIIGYVLFSLVTIILLLPFIISFLNFLPYFSRIDKLPYDGILLDGSFDFAEYISFFFPYSVNGETDIFGATPPSLRNAYFGIFLLVILVYTLIKQKNKKVWLFVGLGLFALTIAAGNYLPVYKVLYHYLPGFGLFKHMSFFRGYAILCFIMAAGIGLENILSVDSHKDKNYIRLFAFVLVIFIAATIYSATQSSLIGIKENLADLIKLNEFPRGGIYTCILINGLITSFLLGVYLYSLIKKKWNHQKLLILLVSLDIFIMFQLSIPSTLINKYWLKGHIEGFAKLPNDIKQSPTTISLKDVSEGDVHIDALWKHKATYSKTLHYLGHNATRSKHFLKMHDNGGLDFIIENPVFYIPFNEITSPENLSPKPNTGWDLPKGIHAQKETKIIGAKIRYNSFVVDVNNPTNKNSLVALSQNYHHLWKATIDDKPITIHKINDGIMGVEIPAFYSGSIFFNFSPSPFLKISFIFSLIGYLVIPFVIFKMNNNSKKLKSST